MSLYFCRNFITHINKKLKIMSKVTVVGAGNVRSEEHTSELQSRE